MEPHLPHDRPCRTHRDDLRIISGILHVLKTGCQWKRRPSEYGGHTTVIIAGPGAGYGKGYLRKWRPTVRFPKNCHWTASPFAREEFSSAPIIITSG
ncbi:hypothetical protein CW354_04890 [Marinicaulis flavus]|uniref:Insertion element IS402-like domain-containing protein n=1 Tax=Hyphococcus luteus TaxID=2058213 RepID=A0A2S7K5C2_9PROT|nr:hypothetical protein CW354_04890 [Marinicaulis flavus]